MKLIAADSDDRVQPDQKYSWKKTQNILPNFVLENHHPNTEVTPRKINIEPENDGLEDDFPFPGMHSQVPR